jgi:hypothetical protein
MDTAVQTAIEDGTDHIAMVELLQRYFRAIYDGDVDALYDIFHPENRLAGWRGADQRLSSLEQWLDRVRSRPGKDAFDFRIIAVDQTGRAGCAKIAYRYHGVDFTDYMSMLKLDGRWRIVSKVFDGYLVDDSDH